MTEFNFKYRALCTLLLEQEPFHTGSWQSTNTSGSSLHETYELQDVIFRLPVPLSIEELTEEITVGVNLPWAEEHFQERIGGLPLNPPPSNQNWPWARHNKRFQQEGDTIKPFSHSYPERFWPKHAGDVECHGPYDFVGYVQPVDRYGQADNGKQVCNGRQGIRFTYGDLQDVVNLLVREPLTRQAYLPIWFPEDTGTHHGERVPCTLGYHFMQRNGVLSCRYYMRSCDIIRHFADDVYMACRLTQWICDEIYRETYFTDRDTDGSPKDPEPQVIPGNLIMYITSLHAFKGDEYKLIKGSRGE